MTKLSFYGGIGEIGGNKVLLEDGGSKIFFDFGMNFNRAGKYYSEFLQPRKCKGLLDFFEFDLLPKIDGIYRRDYLEHSGLNSKETSVDGVFLSHAHADHSSYVHFLRRDIPIYGSSATEAILQALEETSQTGFTELTQMLETFKCYDNRNGNKSRVTKRKEEYLHDREYNSFEETEVNGLEVKRIPVNHSLPGASAYIVETDAGNVVYTGDFRFHGYGGDLTEEFVETASEADPVALITEGTRISEQNSKPEPEVCKEVKEEIDKTDSLAVVNFPVRDTDRMNSFLEAAEDTGRELVVSTKQARLLELLSDTDADAPKVEDVVIYLPNKSWGTVTRDFPERIVRQDFDKWERKYLDFENTATSEDIRKEQSRYVFRCDFFQLKHLIDIQPSEGSRYIRSVTEPFDEEMEIQKERVENWLKHFNLYPYKQVHCSGHANGKQVEEVVSKIDPEYVFPIHTEFPEKFKDFKGKTKLVKYGKEYVL